MNKLDFVGFGALNVDKLFRVDHIAGKDEESSIIESRESCGGSAANTTVGLARLGLKTGYIGKVARDREGRLLLDEFKKQNVDTSGVTMTEKGRSGVVIGFVDKMGERALYVDSGVNDSIDLKEISQDYIRKPKLLHITSFVGEKSFETQKNLVGNLPKRVKVSLDPGMLYSERGLSALRPILRQAFTVLPNEAELELLTGESFEAGARRLLAEGVEVVGVKLGNKGCFVASGDERHIIEPFKVKTVDTTGAGDAWNAGFLYGLIKKMNLHVSGKLGNFVASRCITRMGARNGLPSLAKLRLSGLIT